MNSSQKSPENLQQIDKALDYRKTMPLNTPAVLQACRLTKADVERITAKYKPVQK